MLEFLSPSVPISRSFFLIPGFSGRIVGCWPQSHRSWLTVGIFWISCFLVTMGAFGENLYFIIHRADFQIALEAFCPGIAKAVCTLKMMTFFLNNQSWYRMVFRLKSMLTTDMNPEKSKIAQKLASFGNSLSLLVLLCGSGTNLFFNLTPIITIAYNVWKGKELSYELPFKAVLPGVLREMPYYPLTYLVLAMSGCMTVFTFSFVDGFFVCGCFYICAVFRFLQHDIKELFSELKTREYASVAQNAKFRRRLSEIVVRHNEIIDLCTDFTKQFTVIILVLFLSESLVICLAILNLKLNFGTVKMFIYMFFTTAGFTQLFLYCIGGNFISESSLEVADVLYDIEWYKCDVRTRKMILMMIRRAQKAITVEVPFFTPSLLAFNSIVSTAGSYVTMLQTFL